ncbi:MAG: ankyrin repeat domain-containing protein [Rhodocyclaceae bacterium]|nr:ankyrin repeat domain-containing protein [Rhodocyclaceae bacterium]
MAELFSKLGRRLKAGLRTLGLCTGLMLMMTGNSGAAPVFKLKAPGEYFSDGKTLALLNAALAGDLARARQLVADGANPNDEGPMDKPNRIRLLHYAIAANNPQAVKILMAVGADPELKAEGFGRAFLFAMTLENIGMLSLLLDIRPIATLSKDTLEYMMFESVTQPCPHCLALFLKRGAPIDFPDGSGYTILVRAMDAQDYDFAEWILLQGAAVVREPTISGMTPANAVQFHLNKFKPGSPSYNKVLHLKQLMEARGAVFPALSPKEIREMRGQK